MCQKQGDLPGHTLTEEGGRVSWFNLKREKVFVKTTSSTQASFCELFLQHQLKTAGMSQGFENLINSMIIHNENSVKSRHF